MCSVCLTKSSNAADFLPSIACHHQREGRVIARMPQDERSPGRNSAPPLLSENLSKTNSRNLWFYQQPVSRSPFPFVRKKPQNSFCLEIRRKLRLAAVVQMQLEGTLFQLNLFESATC